MNTQNAPSLIWSYHALERARQRAVPLAVAELAYAEGQRLSRYPDRHLLTKERVRGLRGLGYSEKLLLRAEAAAPVGVVVVRGSRVITVYRPAPPAHWGSARRRERRPCRQEARSA